jgi:hypothetical protein|tara:strand:+ start:4840 stop:5262 length:423 start_codon:yes stop_codon:yes gene_type:complete
MHLDRNNAWIGKGEDTVFKMLSDMYKEPTFEIKRQYMFKDLMNEVFRGSLSERQEKESLDFVIFGETIKTLVIRVQDKHHASLRASGHDIVQKKMLEWNDCNVIDIQFYNCPNIFKELFNNESSRELIEAFQHENVPIPQ